MRITQHLTIARFGACSPVQIVTGVVAPMLLWAVALPVSGEEEITGPALEAALQNQGWQVEHQPNGSSLVLPPDQTGKEFVFREQTPEELAQDPAGNAATENPPESSPSPAVPETGKTAETAAPGKAVAPAKAAAPTKPAKATTPAETRPTATLYPAQPGYSHTGPRRHWRNRYPYRSRAWQRYRHYRGARYPWRGYGYRRGPRYGYSRYYAPLYGPTVPVE